MKGAEPARLAGAEGARSAGAAPFRLAGAAPARFAEAARLRLLRAHTPWRRLCGLLCRRRPPGPHVGVWIAPCRMIHTFGMAYAIDVAFVGRDGRVIRVVRRLRPWRAALCVRAVAVVETRVGILDAEHGGVGRVEAAIQDAARRDIEGHLQRAGQRG